MRPSFFIVFTAIVVISDAFIIVNNSESSFSLNPEDIFDITIPSSTFLPTIESKLIQQYISEKNISVINVNKTSVDYKIELSSTVKPTEETLPIYIKHLVQIAQWKYVDPKTQKIRYWYHTADSTIGDGWIFDGILCQAYIRQKPDTVPVQAFHSEEKGIWTNTLQIETTPLPIGNNRWKYDGTPFYAYTTSMNSTFLKPIWRYWNRINYGTEDVKEPRRSFLRIGDVIDDDLPEWKLDGIIFYAFSPDMNVTQLEI